MNEPSPARKAAEEYLKQTGYPLSSTIKIVQCYINMEGCTIGVNGPDGGASLTLDKETVDKFRLVLKGLREIQRNPRRTS